MKKVLYTLAIVVLGPSFAYSQRVNDTPLSEIDVKYVRIVGTNKFLTTKVHVGIEFGQHNKYWSNKDTQLFDKDGNKLEFNSMIDALNFMEENGYEYRDSYALTVGNQTAIHYLLKKKEQE